MQLEIPHKIITYHDFGNVSNFEKQLQLLSRQKKILLTTDDGDLSFYTTAYPLILKYKIQFIL
mgnify:CR=1 FL=1